MENNTNHATEAEEDTQKDRYLTFNLDKECFGIEIRRVIEIIGIQAITEVPELPEYIRGIINLRGQIIPVMDIRLRFEKNAIEYNDRTCIIVFEIDDYTIGLIVDSVAEVLTIPEEDTEEPPKIGASGNKYIKNVGKVGSDVKLIIDCKKLISEGMEEVS